MYTKKLTVSLLFLLIILAIVGIVDFSKAQTGTQVGGILWDNTTWTQINSPYTITSTIQIPSNVTLTIEPGATINSALSSYSDMFLINGRIYAYGTSDNKIIFDGNKISNIFGPKESTAETFLDLDYCIIRDGLSFWEPSGYSQHGSFRLRHSELTNLNSYSYVWYPYNDVYIEYNSFADCAGFSIGTSNSSVYIRHNLFTNNIGFIVKNWASYSTSCTYVNYNSFIGTSGIILSTENKDSNSNILAENNYWGTTDTNIINSMIWDRNDDITLPNFINYLPILEEPSILTPIALTPTSSPAPTPTANPTSNPTNNPTQAPTNNPTATTQPSPTVPEFPFIAILSFTLLASTISLIILKKKAFTNLKIVRSYISMLIYSTFLL